MVSNDGRSEKEIRSRMGQAKRAFLLKSKLFTSKIVDLTEKKKKRSIKTYKWSTELNGCEEKRRNRSRSFRNTMLAKYEKIIKAIAKGDTLRHNKELLNSMVSYRKV